jgi:hypothetical protein
MAQIREFSCDYFNIKRVKDKRNNGFSGGDVEPLKVLTER